MTPVTIRSLDTASPDFESRVAQLRHWSTDDDAAIEQSVASILADVRLRGDAALLAYTARFDQVEVATVASLELSDGTRVQVGKSTESRDELLRRFRSLLGAVATFVLILGLLGGVVLTRSSTGTRILSR